METEHTEAVPEPVEQSVEDLSGTVSGCSSSGVTPEKRRVSVADKTTTATDLSKYDKNKRNNDKDDIWWEQRGSKANKHLPVKDPNASAPHTGNFLNPTTATILGSKAKYQEPPAKAAAAITRPIGQDSHLLTPTPAFLHGRAHDDTADINRKEVTQPKLAPVPVQYKDVPSKLLEPTTAVKAATYVKAERPVEDERERKWVVNTVKGHAIDVPLPAVPKSSTEKRSPDKSTLQRPTAASKAASIEGATSVSPPPAPTLQERYVNEQYASVPSRLYESTATSKNSKKEKAKASPSKAFKISTKVDNMDESLRLKPVTDKYADVPARLHASTASADAKKKKVPPEEAPRRKSIGRSSEPYQSHVLQSTTATKLGVYHKPESLVEVHHVVKPIMSTSHLLTPTPASIHQSKNDPTIALVKEPPHKPKLEHAPGYEHVQSRLTEDTAARKNSAYVKKEKEAVDERESHWVGVASRSPVPERTTPSPVPINSDYSSVASRLHQDTVAHKNAAYVKKTDGLPPSAKPRRHSHNSTIKALTLPVTPVSEDDLTVSYTTTAPTDTVQAPLPEVALAAEANPPIVIDTPLFYGEEIKPVLHTAHSEATDMDSANAVYLASVSDEDDKEKEFSIGDLKEGVEKMSLLMQPQIERADGNDHATLEA